MKSKLHNVLITGATGFVGSHLLSKLIQKENVGTIFVVSRHADNKIGINDSTSLLPVFAKHSLPFAGLAKKVRIIHGDISCEQIGISPDLYSRLTKVVDVIYHVAATVNHMKSVEDLSAANVNSVKELITFSEMNRGKIINFVSTMGAACDRNDKGFLTETMPSQCESEFSMGYLASKQKAEQLLSKVKNANIFRLGYVSGHSKTGVSLSYNNQLMMLIKSCIQLGVAPSLDRVINLTPVDFVAEVMQQDAFLSTSGSVLHVVNTKEFITWRELVLRLNQSGYPIKIISVAEWQSIFVKCDRSNALYSMKLKYRRKDVDNHVLLFAKNSHEYCFDKMKALCDDNDIVQVQIKGDYFDTIINYLQDTGFLNFPYFFENRKAV
jgi:thioester reductase-like protein